MVFPNCFLYIFVDLPARSGENRMGTKASEEELQSASKLRSQVKHTPTLVKSLHSHFHKGCPRPKILRPGN